MGATLTTTQSSGNILIAFTATFIPSVASRLWKMLCFAFHTCSSKRGAQGTIYHQRQVVLGNSSSADAGTFSLLVLLWVWRRLQAKTLVRLLPLLIFGILFIVGFTLTGGYSSQISSVAGDEVLINGENCSIFSPPSTDDANFTGTIAHNTWIANKMDDAANYVQQYYAHQGANVFDCNRFVVQSLPTETSDGNAGCPFANDHMGLNAPQDRRFLWRMVLSCAPLKTDGYTSSHIYNNRTFIGYNYGRRYGPGETLFNYTISVQDVQSQYAQTEHVVQGTNFRVQSSMAMSFNGSLSETFSDFVPDHTIETPDGDIILVFLSGNGVTFAQESDDAWYRATSPYGTEKTLHSATYGNAYTTTEAASPLGCKQQFQWCNSEYGIPKGCGPLTGWLDATAGAYPLFNLSADNFNSPGAPPFDTEPGSRLDWAAGLDTLSGAGIPNLLGGVQLGLSKNQWQLGVTKWWNTTLALHQAGYVDVAVGHNNTDANLQRLVDPPSNEYQRHFCQNQKIRQAGYASFSMFGLLFTYILGALIILMSFALDPIMCCLHRRAKYRQYQYLEWRTNGALQLHRLGQDELGCGKWSGCTDITPVTRPEDRLADLDISDLEYPRLNRELVVVEEEEEVKPEADSHTETVGSDQASAEASENITVQDMDTDHAPGEPQRTSEAEDVDQAQMGLEGPILENAREANSRR
ncbi:cytochrome p450 protein [Apiospora phragmitis]|uniref:Cytochrome p450 protein n=1 Tax=Apiospora phragmitis TaxID=2905665 RepID=A0ABR1WRR3_9PEZI